MSYRLIIRTSELVLLTVLLAACAHTRTTPFDMSARPERRTPPDSIRLYGAQRPICPYDEVGRVTAESRLFVSWGRVIGAARKAAHELGGDAIVGAQDKSRISSTSVTPQGVAIDETESLSGIVIRFKSLECMK